MTYKIVKKQRLLKKGIGNSVYKQGLLFEKSKEKDKFKACKTHISATKASESRSDNKFWIVLMM